MGKPRKQMNVTNGNGNKRKKPLRRSNAKKKKAGPFTISCDFTEIVSTYYIDKTLLIKTLLENNKMVLVSAPRFFGKTTNMDMVKKFLEIKVDKKGKPIADVTTTSNYKLFKNNNLKICEPTYEEFFNKHFGRHPVIHVNLKHLGTVNSFKNMLYRFKLILRCTFTEYEYLLDVRNFWGGDLNMYTFKHYIIEKERIKLLNELDLKVGLKFLSQILGRYFKKQVFVLIDDFDSLAKGTIFTTHNQEYKQCIDFLREAIFNLFKDNKYIEGALLNGCLNVAQMYLPNNITQYKFSNDHIFSEYYGLTENEVEKFLTQFNVLDQLANVQNWYDGYTSNNVSKIYCTWSIIMFVCNKNLRHHWIDVNYVKNMEQFFLINEIKKKMEQLLNNEIVSINYVERMTMEQIILLRKMFECPPVAVESKEDADLFIQLLHELGYLQKTKSDDLNIQLLIPNKEIGIAFSNMLHTVSYYKDTFDTENINEFCKALELLEAEEKSTFINLAKSLKNLYSTVLPKNKFEFCSSLFTFIKNSAVKFTNVLSESYTPEEYNRLIDLFVIRKDGRAVIMELQYDEELPENALKQLFDKQYYEVLTNYYKDEIKKDIFYIGVCLNNRKEVTLGYLVNNVKVLDAEYIVL